MRYCGWKCLWCSLISHPCSSEIHRGGCNGGSNTMALRCYLCPSLCWSDCRWDLECGEEKRAVGLDCSAIRFSLLFFFPLVEQDGKQMVLLPSKQKRAPRNLLVLIPCPPGEMSRVRRPVCMHIADTHMQRLSLLVLNTPSAWEKCVGGVWSVCLAWRTCFQCS